MLITEPERSRAIVEGAHYRTPDRRYDCVLWRISQNTDSQMPALYLAPLPDFPSIKPEQLLGALTSGLANEGFDTTTRTTFSWQQEIVQLQDAFQRLLMNFPQASGWSVLLEYVLPIVGLRVDCVLLADDLIYVIEYKGGTSATSRAALRQAQEML